MAYEFAPGEYELANGLKAKVWERRGNELLGYWESKDGNALLERWKFDGTNSTPSFSLLPPKQTRTVWVNVYEQELPFTYMHLSRERADMHAASNSSRIACKEITIEFVPGEGLAE